MRSSCTSTSTHARAAESDLVRRRSPRAAAACWGRSPWPGPSPAASRPPPPPAKRGCSGVSRRSAEGAADVGAAHRRIVGALVVHAEALLDDLLRLLRRAVAERHGPTPAVAQPASSNVAAIGACARSRALRWVCGCQWHCWARVPGARPPLDGAGGPHQCAARRAARAAAATTRPRAHVS